MVIRMRHTRAHTANRRSHHALEAPTLAICGNCSAKHRPHHACLECGFYKGRMIVDMAAKKKARDERLQAKRETINAQKGEEAESDPEQAIPTEEVAEAKLMEIDAPEIAKTKKATPRKGQAA
jgi:large subunit ribosomal protein L32